MTITTISGTSNTYAVDTTVAAGDTLRFDPAVATTLTMNNKNLVVEGILEMKPNAGVTHLLRFTNIDESVMVGGGLDVVSTDIGLWVMGAGKLDLAGAVKSGWLRTNGGLAAGATSLTLASVPTGWQVGDEIVIVPTGSGDFSNFEVRTLTDVSGATLTWSGGLSVAHPQVNALWNPEVANLTRSVNIEGTATGKTHIFIRSSVAQPVKHVALRHMGPLKNGAVVVGRWPIHFHHADEGSVGSLIEGCVVRDVASHAYVSHESSGTTYLDCVAYDVLATPYWWDVVDFTDDTVYDHCLAAKVDSEPGTNGRDLTGFWLGRGSNNTTINCVAVGVAGSTNSFTNGYEWPEAANNTSSNWVFDDNISHNNKNVGTFAWENHSIQESPHVINRFVSYRNKNGSMRGAYISRFQWNDCVMFDNSQAGMSVHAMSMSGEPMRIASDVVTGSPHSVALGEHAATVSVPGIFLECQFNGFTSNAVAINNGLTSGQPSMYDFVRCTVNGSELEFNHFTINHFRTGGRIRVQRADNTAYQFDHTADPVVIDPFYELSAVVTVTTTELRPVATDESYNTTLAAVNGTAPYTWSIVAGSLPAGLSLSGATGVISGTPTGGLGISTFTVRVTDDVSATDDQELSIEVVDPLIVTTNSLARAIVGRPSSQVLAASGGDQSFLAWTVIDGSLPPGTAMELHGGLASGTGVISGTPTSEGPFNFVVKVEDLDARSDTATLSINVRPSRPPPGHRPRGGRNHGIRAGVPSAIRGAGFDAVNAHRTRGGAR